MPTERGFGNAAELPMMTASAQRRAYRGGGAGVPGGPRGAGGPKGGRIGSATSTFGADPTELRGWGGTAKPKGVGGINRGWPSKPRGGGAEHQGRPSCSGEEVSLVSRAKGRRY